MDADDGVLEAARAVRPHLIDLVGPDAAADLDRQLADELTDTSDWSGSACRLRTLLDNHEGTAWFLAQVLQDTPRYRPPYQQLSYRIRRHLTLIAQASLRGGVVGAVGGRVMGGGLIGAVPAVAACGAVVGGVVFLAGHPMPIDAARYICPERDDYVWYQPDVGTPIPDCPSCHIVLTRT